MATSVMTRASNEMFSMHVVPNAVMTQSRSTRMTFASEREKEGALLRKIMADSDAVARLQKTAQVFHNIYWTGDRRSTIDELMSATPDAWILQVVVEAGGKNKMWMISPEEVLKQGDFDDVVLRIPAKPKDLVAQGMQQCLAAALALRAQVRASGAPFLCVIMDSRIGEGRVARILSLWGGNSP